MATFYASYPFQSSGGGGGTVSDINGLTGSITLAPGSGISITPSGNILTIAATGTSGVTTIGIFDSQAPAANGLTISGVNLYAQSASVTVPGMVNNTTQSFSGNKTFTGTIAASNFSGTNTGDITIGTPNGLGLVGQVLSLQQANSINFGALAPSDWVIFNNKQQAITINVLDFQPPNANGLALVSGFLSTQSADATHPGVVNNTTQTFSGNKTFTGTISASNFSGTITGTNTGDVTIGTANGLSIAAGQILSLALSSTSTTGALSSTDWNTFNGKQAAGNYITALTGDVTATGPGSVAATIANNAVTNAKLAQMPTLTIKGNNTGGTGNALDLTVAQVNTMLGDILANGTVPFTGSQSLGGFNITNSAAPVNPNDLTTKAYVDNFINATSWKTAVLVATTANITLSGEQTIDGFLTSASRVLVKNQTAPAENGIYVSAAGAWTRSTDMDSWAEVPAAATFVQEGTINADIGYVCTSQPGGTLGTTAITWVMFSSAGAYSADNVTLQLISGVFSIKNNGVSNTQLAQMAAHTYKGNNTGSTANALDVTSTQLTADLNLFSSTLQGLVPASGGGTTNFLRADGTFAAPPGATSGTVTSVALADSTALFNITGSPVTTSGTLTLASFQSKAQNTFFAAPNGSAGAPTFRLIVAADVPTLNQNTTGTASNVTGVVAIANGGTGQTTKAAAFDALSPMTTGGDLIYGGAAGTGTRLANGSAGQVLTSGGTTVAPTWTTPTTGTVTSVALTVPAFLSVAGSPVTSSGTLAVSFSGTALPVANGGTGVTSVTTTPTATSFAGWDANKNLSANSFLAGYTTTTTAAGTTTLVVGSTQQQYFTGTTTQTVVLPVVSTLVLGQNYIITNNSTGLVTVQSSGANTLQAMSGSTQLVATVIAITGTGTASWSWAYTQLNFIPPTSAISASAIDWSLGNVFTKTLGANTTFTFSNNTNGQTIVVRLTNTASNFTVTWPTVRWAGGTPPTMSPGAVSDVYTFIYDGSNFYGSAVQNMT